MGATSQHIKKDDETQSQGNNDHDVVIATDNILTHSNNSSANCRINFWINKFSLTHFMSLISFDTPRTSGFLMFSGGIERDQWHKGWYKGHK